MRSESGGTCFPRCTVVIVALSAFKGDSAARCDMAVLVSSIETPMPIRRTFSTPSSLGLTNLVGLSPTPSSNI
jgi:hypothetical protein